MTAPKRQNNFWLLSFFFLGLGYFSFEFDKNAIAKADSGLPDLYTRSKACEPLGEDAILICGTASKQLGEQVSKYLGQSPVDAEIKRFADGETSVFIKSNVKGKHVYIV